MKWKIKSPPEDKEENRQSQVKLHLWTCSHLQLWGWVCLAHFPLHGQFLLLHCLGRLQKARCCGRGFIYRDNGRHCGIFLGVIVLNRSCAFQAQTNGIWLKNVVPLRWQRLLSPWHSTRKNGLCMPSCLPNITTRTVSCGWTSARHHSFLRTSRESKQASLPGNAASRKDAHPQRIINIHTSEGQLSVTLKRYTPTQERHCASWEESSTPPNRAGHELIPVLPI